MLSQGPMSVLAFIVSHAKHCLREECEGWVFPAILLGSLWRTLGQLLSLVGVSLWPRYRGKSKWCIRSIFVFPVIYSTSFSQTFLWLSLYLWWYGNPTWIDTFSCTLKLVACFHSWNLTAHFIYSFIYVLFKDFIYLFLERDWEEKRETERDKNINMKEKHRLIASCTPLTRNWASNVDTYPTRTELQTIRFAGGHPTTCTTPLRAHFPHFKENYQQL